MEKRSALRPYKKQRLLFEGVLIHVIPPNKKNGYTHGLVFGSLYAPNEDIQLDHAVIEIDKGTFVYNKFELFKRYSFTAKVTSYHKTGPIMGIQVKQECFMLEHINPNRIEKIEESRIAQPTLYIQTRIRNILASKCENVQVRYTEEQLNEIVTTMPNDGQVEEFMSVYTKSHQIAKVDAFDIIKAVYQ